MVAGFSLGYQPAWITDNATSIADRGWLIVLSSTTECLALLTIGLVRPWGEVLPDWVPMLGGRRIPSLAASVPAAVGAVLLTLLWAMNPVLFTDLFHDPLEPQGGWRTLMASCYLPLMLWGPLLGAVTWDYRRRTKLEVK